MNTSETQADRQNGTRLALIVAGASLTIFALVLLGSGGVLVGVHSTKPDRDGFYTSGSHLVSTPTQAFVVRKLDVGTDGPDFLFRKGRLGTLRVTATGTPSEPIFVGITRQGQVDRYLRRVAYDEVEDFDLDPFSITTRRHPGPAEAAPPTTRPIWAASVTGPGRQDMRWHVQKGNWAVVVMNADGSPRVATNVSVGAKLPFLLWLGVGLLIGGAALAITAGWLIVTGSRRAAPTSASVGVPAAGLEGGA
jgi:hypothetical protein